MMQNSSQVYQPTTKHPTHPQHTVITRTWLTDVWLTWEISTSDNKQYMVYNIHAVHVGEFLDRKKWLYLQEKNACGSDG